MGALEAFAAWLGKTPLNAVVVAQAWVIPAVQVVHILCVAAVMGAVAIVNLRVFGWIEADQSLKSVTDRFLPTLPIALPGLAITGLILISGEPNRALFRTVFWLKMAMIAAASALAFALHRQLARAEPGTSGGAAVSLSLKAQAAASMALWLGVIVAGRWIGYATGWPGSPQ